MSAKTRSGSKKNDITDGWRKLHTKELHNIYTDDIIFLK
jgi:hypothetical protein